jgi:micrococcal nuclease
MAAALLFGCAPTPDGNGAPNAPAAGIPDAAQAATVERVVDGDTIWVRVDEPGGRLPPATHKVRLLEIDAPETAQSPAGAECGGEEATAFANRHIPVGTEVFLLHDREDTDRYDRFLRYAWTSDGLFFNLEAVRSGRMRAVLFEPNDAYIEQLRAAEDDARGAGRGIWGEYCPAVSS